MHLVAKLDGFHWSLHVTRDTKDFGSLTLLRNLSRSKIKVRTELLLVLFQGLTRIGTEMENWKNSGIFHEFIILQDPRLTYFFSFFFLEIYLTYNPH